MTAVPATIDVGGVPVGAGGICVIRREAYLPGMLGVGVVTGSLPPLLIIGAIVAASSAGIEILGSSAGSTMVFAGVLALLLLAPLAITRPLIRRWAAFETRYEITPEGVRRTSARRTCAFVWKLPPNRTFQWTDVSVENGGSSGVEVSDNAPFIPWFTRRIGFRDGSPPLVISGTSDWLNPEPPFLLLDDPGDPWAQPKLEDFIGACIAAFAETYRR